MHLLSMYSTFYSQRLRQYCAMCMNGELKRYKKNFICMTLVCFGLYERVFVCNAFIVRVKCTSCTVCMMACILFYHFNDRIYVRGDVIPPCKRDRAFIKLHHIQRREEKNSNNNNHQNKRSGIVAFFFSWTHSNFSCRLSILWCKMMVWLLVCMNLRNDVCNIKTISTNHWFSTSFFYSYT